MPLTLPIAIPYAAERFAHRGHPWAGSVYSFGVIKLTTVQIAQREMRKVEIFHIPRGGLRRIAVDSLPKKSQFESEPPSVCRFQISRVVPPFGLIIRMIKMIAGEFVAVSRQGCTVLRRKRLPEKERGCNRAEHTLHGRQRLK